MFKILFFVSMGPFALSLLLAASSSNAASTLTYKDCGFGQQAPNSEFLAKADDFKKKYGDKAKVEWINDERCQGVHLRYSPDGTWK